MIGVFGPDIDANAAIVATLVASAKAALGETMPILTLDRDTDEATVLCRAKQTTTRSGLLIVDHRGQWSVELWAYLFEKHPDGRRFVYGGAFAVIFVDRIVPTMILQEFIDVTIFPRTHGRPPLVKMFRSPPPDLQTMTLDEPYRSLANKYHQEMCEWRDAAVTAQRDDVVTAPVPAFDRTAIVWRSGVVVGLLGPPACGKSALANALYLDACESVDSGATVLVMDEHDGEDSVSARLNALMSDPPRRVIVMIDSVKRWSTALRALLYNARQYHAIVVFTCVEPPPSFLSRNIDCLVLMGSVPADQRAHVLANFPAECVRECAASVTPSTN